MLGVSFADFEQRKHTARWCNGNTSDFGSDIHGSSPCRVANPEYVWCSGFFYALSAKASKLATGSCLASGIKLTSAILISVGLSPVEFG